MVGWFDVVSILVLLINSWIEECNFDFESYFFREFLNFEIDWKDDMLILKVLSWVFLLWFLILVNVC